MNAINASTLATPIGELGKRMHVVGQEMLRLESLELFESKAYRQLDNLHDELIYRAMGSEPVTLRDAAVLALCVAEQAGFLDDGEMQPEDAAPFMRRIVVANASILLALMKAGVRVDDIGPHDAEYEVSRHRRELSADTFKPEPPAVSPDKRLLDITREYFSLRTGSDARYEAVYKGTPPGSAEEKEVNDAGDDQRYPQMSEIEIEAEKIEPTTPEGFAAKARLVESNLMRHRGTDGDPDGSITLAMSLCRDLIGRVAV